jgi:hypothetical protein
MPPYASHAVLSGLERFGAGPTVHLRHRTGRRATRGRAAARCEPVILRFPSYLELDSAFWTSSATMLSRDLVHRETVGLEWQAQELIFAYQQRTGSSAETPASLVTPWHE